MVGGAGGTLLAAGANGQYFQYNKPYYMYGDKNNYQITISTTIPYTKHILQLRLFEK